jgi:oligopeptidase B
VLNDVRSLYSDTAAAATAGGGEAGFADAPLLEISIADAVAESKSGERDASADGALKLLKQREVPNFDPSLDTSRRIVARAPHDDLERSSGGSSPGVTVDVPISLVFRKDAWGKGETPDAPMPMLLDGYGSYAYCNDPYFDADILPLLDRGAIWAVAHVRGGGEMGRATWYEDGGKFGRKSNTFSDFVACARALIEAKITSSDRLAIEGRSAGGLLVGAVLNRDDAHERDAVSGIPTRSIFQCAVAGVPFVDVMATMSDASIPLTCGEWEEWGNPHESKAFADMVDYSPIDNVAPLPYPALLATAGLPIDPPQALRCGRL